MAEVPENSKKKFNKDTLLIVVIAFVALSLLVAYIFKDNIKSQFRKAGFSNITRECMDEVNKGDTDASLTKEEFAKMVSFSVDGTQKGMSTPTWRSR